jgi:hypothetical protein
MIFLIYYIINKEVLIILGNAQNRYFNSNNKQIIINGIKCCLENEIDKIKKDWTYIKNIKC